MIQMVKSIEYRFFHVKKGRKSFEDSKFRDEYKNR